MSLKRHDGFTRHLHRVDVSLTLVHVVRHNVVLLSLQFKAIPFGPMPPATPKFAYGFVMLTKVRFLLLFFLIPPPSILLFVKPQVVLGIIFLGSHFGYPGASQ